MKTKIKAHWEALKERYQNTYHSPIFTNYELSVPFVKDLKTFVLALLKDTPDNVCAISILASLNQELRRETHAIKVLEDFIKTYEQSLSASQKARLYTNLAFYYEGDEKELEHLLKAEKLASPFTQTYKGLALTYFSKYTFDKNTKNLEKSLLAFEKALKLNDGYEMHFGYAVCLFELEQYEEAKALFEALLLNYPKRMRLLLSLAYCEIYLNNKEKALHYLAQVKEGQDENYPLNTDDIGDYQIYDAYYALEVYESFLKEYETVIADNFFPEIAYYYYALWITGKYQKFDEEIEKQKQKILSWIEETKTDEDFTDEKDRQDYIKTYKEDLENLIELENKIKNLGYKPIAKLELYPEYGCYLIDCIRHNF